MSSLAERMMLVSLNLSVYSGVKTDTKVTEDVISLAGAARRSGKFHKNLFADALEEIQQAANAARNDHAKLTLPWRYGQNCLPSAMFMRYMEVMRGHHADFDRAVAKFTGDYEAHVEHAKSRLGKLFQESDYPPAATVGRRFAFDIEVTPLPNVSDFRVEMIDNERAEIEADIERRILKRVQEGREDLIARIKECLERMVTRLNGYTGAHTGRFSDTLVTNLVDLAELIPSLNLTDDPEIESLRADIISKLTRHPAQSLREDEALRQSVARDAKAMLDNMKGALA